MERLVQILHEKACTLVVEKDDDIRTFHQRGVADLLYLLQNDPEFLQNARVADKVVGKAAAALMIKGNIKQLYADKLSAPAWKLLKEQSHIATEFMQLIPFVENRDKSDWCPLEKLCYSKDSIEDMYRSISEFSHQARNSTNGNSR